MKSEYMFTFLRGFTTARPDFPDTAKALFLARKYHAEQVRKNGEPYIVHPLTMACHAIALGITNDAVIASCLLHDVMEDCGVTKADLMEEGISAETNKIVTLLTKQKAPKDHPELKEVYTATYYQNLQTSPLAALVKLLDRCNNVSTMAGAFSNEKIEEYCQETHDYVLPLAKHLKESMPAYGNLVMALTYHINSVVDMAEWATGKETK